VNVARRGKILHRAEKIEFPKRIEKYSSSRHEAEPRELRKTTGINSPTPAAMNRTNTDERFSKNHEVTVGIEIVTFRTNTPLEMQYCRSHFVLRTKQ
jgi:hypothetical protein